MSVFEGRVKELENILIDNFLSHESHTCFFLSHCHTDHMEGLEQLFLNSDKEPNKYIYCSSISRLILQNKYNNACEAVIKELSSPREITIPGNNRAPSYQVTVTPIPAGHCLGSVMFLFETVKNRILYTGDFRFLKNDIRKFKPLHNNTQVKLIDKLYFDSTFLSDSYWDFPSRFEVVSELINLIHNWISQSPVHNVLLITCAQYGYEFIFTEVAKKLKCKIHVRDALHDLFYNIPEVGCFLTKDCKSTKIHASTVFNKKCLTQQDDKLELRIKLSAQWYKSVRGRAKKKIWKKISEQYILMCYSTHCSCSELVDFLNYLQPKRLEPCTIAVGSTEADTKAYTEQLHQSWYSLEERENQEIVKADFKLEKNYRFKLKFPGHEVLKREPSCINIRKKKTYP